MKSSYIITSNVNTRVFVAVEIMKNVKTSSRYKQRGITRYGMIMLFFIISGFLTVGLAVAPIYVDHNLLVGICEDLLSNGELEGMTQGDLRRSVSDGLRINNIYQFNVSSIKLRREDGAPIITINYERRTELFANLDIVAKFDTVLQ